MDVEVESFAAARPLCQCAADQPRGRKTRREPGTNRDNPAGL